MTASYAPDEAVVHGVDGKVIFFKKDCQRLGKVHFILCDQQPHKRFPL